MTTVVTRTQPVSFLVSRVYPSVGLKLRRDMCCDLEVNKSNMTSSEPMVIGASLPLSAVLSMALNSSAPTTASSTTITTTTTTSSNSDDEINNIIPGVSCSRPAAAREYAFVDCSEVYLAGKRTSGIYEIW